MSDIPHPQRGGLRASLAIARRDLLEFVRDRRTLLVTLLLPMVTYPIIALSTAFGVRTAVSDLEDRQVPTQLTIAFSGSEATSLAERIAAVAAAFTSDSPAEQENWPASLRFLLVDATEGQQTIDGGDADVWLDAAPGLLAALDGKGTTELLAQLPKARPSDPRVREEFMAVMRQVAEDARQRRLADAGLPASTLRPLRVQFADDGISAPLHTPGLLPTLAGAILVLLAVLTMTGAFYPAIDAIAGEKERGTIETLLMAPCGAQEIVFGKFLAVFAVTLATLAANCLSIALTAGVALYLLPASIALGVPNMAGGGVVTVLAFIGLAALAAATCLAVTTASKSGKEAQNTLTPVILLVSALAGAALLPGMRSDGLLALVPFAGQVMVASSALTAVEAGPEPTAAVSSTSPSILLPLALTLLSSAVLTWLLLRGTAAILTDEEILFRGPDSATSPLTRPAPRALPSVGQGMMPIVIGLAALWYLQGLAPKNLLLAIPLHQLMVVLIPLGATLWWQRVDLRRTLAWAWPPASPQFGQPVWWRTACSLSGAGLIGAALFLLGAAVLLSARGTGLSAEARDLSARLVSLLLKNPWWLSWLLMALLPAVCEELLFRGWTLGAFAGDAPPPRRLATAVVAQAVLFALVHLMPERMPSTFVLGLATGALRIATGSLLPAIVCHAIHNSIPLLLLVLSGEAGSGMAESLREMATGTSAQLPPGAVALAIAALVGGVVLVAAGVGAIGGRGAAKLICASLALWLLSTGTAPAAGEGGPEVWRVGVAPIASAVSYQNGKPIGVAVALWEEMAQRIGVTSEYVKEPSLLVAIESVAAKKVDMLLGPLALTREREQVIDLTHPIFHSGLRIAVRAKSPSGWLGSARALLSWDLLKLTGLVISLALVTGHLLWWFERRGNPESFPRSYFAGVWEATWWSISTVITGGCDNKHVSSMVGRLIALGWMLGGIFLVALFTSTLTATMTMEQIQGNVHGPRDLAGRTIGCQAGAVSVAAVRQRGGVPVEFPTLEEVFAAADADLVEAVVGENLSLMAGINQPDRTNFKIVGPVFESLDFGLALPNGSPQRERLNEVILAMREDGSLQRILDSWLGKHD